MSVHKKLMDARLALYSLPLKKSGHNKFAGYHYFELGDFLPQTMEVFHAANLCGVVSFDADMARLTIIDLEDKSELVITSPMASAALKGAHDIQNLGAVQTYMRRYLWVTAMEIVENDVIDGGPTVEKPAAPKEKPAVKEAPKAEAPKAEPPAKIVGDGGAWQIKASLQPDGSVEEWIFVIDQACTTALEMASSSAEVMEIYKKNKQLFESVKKHAPEFFQTLMGKFSATKKKLGE